MYIFLLFLQQKPVNFDLYEYSHKKVSTDPAEFKPWHLVIGLFEALIWTTIVIKDFDDSAFWMLFVTIAIFDSVLALVNVSQTSVIYTYRPNAMGTGLPQIDRQHKINMLGPLGILPVLGFPFVYLLLSIFVG